MNLKGQEIGRKHRMSFIKAIAFAGLAALSSCGSNSSINEIKKTWDGIFATRPQNRTHFIALYRLKSPALLEGRSAGVTTAVATVTGASSQNPSLIEPLDPAKIQEIE